jgi:hypothetical protein
MSIKATALLKKETKIDPRKPQDKAFYASLCLLNADGKGCGPPRLFSEFTEVVVLLRREMGVTHEQLHERFAAYQRGEEVSFCSDIRKRRGTQESWVRPKDIMTVSRSIQRAIAFSGFALCRNRSERRQGKGVRRKRRQSGETQKSHAHAEEKAMTTSIRLSPLRAQIVGISRN